jgi:hypothetical protein
VLGRRGGCGRCRNRVGLLTARDSSLSPAGREDALHERRLCGVGGPLPRPGVRLQLGDWVADTSDPLVLPLVVVAEDFIGINVLGPL